MTATSYMPGEWFGVIGDHATVLLPDSEKERAGAIWALVDDGAGFAEVLDALVAPGLSTLTAFVLIAAEAHSTRVVVRGGVSASFDTAAGPIVVSGASAGTWAERTLTGVSRFSVTLPAAGPAGTDPDAETVYVVRGGLVRVAGIEVPPAVLAAEEVELPAFDPGYGFAEESAGAAAPEPAVTDFLPSPPVYEPPAVTPVTPPSGPHVPVSSFQTSADEPATGSLSFPVARLELSNGQQVDVDRVVVIGRAPDPSRVSDTDQPLLVSVPSPHQEISSTHLEVRPGSGIDHGLAVVTDLGSTNGTVLTLPGHAAEELRAGVPVALSPGAIIDLGDGLTVRVTAP